MAREINLPEPDQGLSDADFEALSAADCALEISKQLSKYYKEHGLTQPKGPGMKLLARARTLLTEFVETEASDGSVAYARLINAVSAVYYAAFWHPDRNIEAGPLWEELRDAAGFEHGLTQSMIEPSVYEVFLVPKKHAAMIKSTLEYLQQTDPV